MLHGSGIPYILHSHHLFTGTFDIFEPRLHMGWCNVRCLPGVGHNTDVSATGTNLGINDMNSEFIGDHAQYSMGVQVFLGYTNGLDRSEGYMSVMTCNLL